MPAASGRSVLVATTCALLLGACATQDDSSAEAAIPSASAATGAPAGKRIPVVASTNVYGDIVARIGGDRVEVTSIIDDPGQDPHSYEASARTRLTLSKARLVVANGGGYDDFVGTMFGSADDGDRTLLEAVEVSGRKAPDGGELNEHVWYDLPGMSALAARIADVLAKVEPASSSEFQANAGGFRAALADLTARAGELKSGHSGARVAVTEAVPLYLLEACGLENSTPEEFGEAIEEGTDVPARVLAETLALIESGEVEALVYNEQTAGPQTEQLRAAAQRTGVPVVGVGESLPAGKSYLDWMGGTLDALRDALGDGLSRATATGSPSPSS